MKKYIHVFALSLAASLIASTQSIAQQNINNFTKAKAASNPDISANLMGLYSKSNRASHVKNGLRLQEAELQFTADVDPYLRALALIGFHPEAMGDPNEFEVHPEEVYAETTFIKNLTLKGGKFFVAIGKHNAMHTHTFAFVDRPLANKQVLGDENYSDAGISASYLLPTPWFSEFTAQLVTGSNETLFNSGSENDFAGITHLKNLWDLNASSTFEFGLSGATGKNQFDRYSLAYGADVTLKWRPEEGGKYKALSWSTEYLGSRVNGGEDVSGIASWLQYQFAERWWASVRGDHLGLFQDADEPKTLKESAIIGFYPTEFSGFRMQYDHSKTTDQPSEHRVALQWNVSIGAHPAHAY